MAFAPNGEAGTSLGWMTNGVEIEAEAFAYLDITDPLVAWLVYRGELVTARLTHPNTLSFWATGYLRHLALNARRYHTELALEEVRRNEFPNAVNRLEGFYVFLDEASARAAAAHWGCAFDLSHLAEVGIVAGSRTSTHDAEWISNKLGEDLDCVWMRAYLRGEPHGDAPIWETLVDGRALVFGTSLRQAAYEVVKAEWPRSLALLELSRVAPYLDSDLGLVSAFVVNDDRGERVRYFLNFVDAQNPDFLTRLAEYTGPKNTQDLDATSELVPPDLTRREFQPR